jgi:hemerythrin-like metal-binding protein
MLEKYKLGIEIIDIQHQKIFDIIDKLILIYDSGDSESFSEIIEELIEYSMYHFETEEEYFKVINFYDAENHINLHNVFIQTINYYSDEEKDSSTIKKMYSFLQHWIKKHILIEDKKYIKIQKL